MARFKLNQRLKQLPRCANCGKEVPDNFLCLEKGKESHPCCSQECIDKLHEKITGKKPQWVVIHKSGDQR